MRRTQRHPRMRRAARCGPEAPRLPGAPKKQPKTGYKTPEFLIFSLKNPLGKGHVRRWGKKGPSGRGRWGPTGEAASAPPHHPHRTAAARRDLLDGERRL